jgi:hypothetical protein
VRITLPTRNATSISQNAQRQHPTTSSAIKAEIAPNKGTSGRDVWDKRRKQYHTSYRLNEWYSLILVTGAYQRKGHKVPKRKDVSPDCERI